MHIQKRHPGIGIIDTWNSRKYDDGIVDDIVVKLEHLQPFEMRLDGSQIRTVRCSTRCLLHHLQGLGRSLTTVTQRLISIQVAGARQRGRSVLCTCGRDVPMFWAWRDASPAPIVCLLTSVCSAHSLIQRQPSSSNRVLHLHLGVQ